MAEKNPQKEEKKTKNAACDEQAHCSKRGANYVVMRNTLNWDRLPTENRFIGKRQLGIDKPLDLEDKIKRKVLELVSKEETLVSLYKKAAEKAKQKEEEFNEKSDLLAQQIQRDKDLIKMLKRC